MLRWWKTDTDNTISENNLLSRYDDGEILGQIVSVNSDDSREIIFDAGSVHRAVSALSACCHGTAVNQ